jgi:hypothetical protein
LLPARNLLHRESVAATTPLLLRRPALLLACWALRAGRWLLLRAWLPA